MGGANVKEGERAGPKSEEGEWLWPISDWAAPISEERVSGRGSIRGRG